MASKVIPLQSFSLTLDTLGDVSEKLAAYLRVRKTDDKDVQTTLLLLEEISVQFFDRTPSVPLNVVVRDHLGRITVSMEQEGDEFNPIADIKDWNTESENYFRTLIFRANSEKLDYARHNGKNIVHIRAHKPKYHHVVLSLASLAAGILLGLIMVWTLTPKQAALIDLEVFDTIRTMFFNALGALIVPTIFFSVVTTIASLSSLSDTGRLGIKTMRSYLGTTVIAIAISFVVTLIALPEELPKAVQSFATGSASGSSTAILSREELIDIIPHDILSPITDDNVMQVMLLAVFVGIGLLILGDKIQVMNKLLEDMTRLFQILVNIVTALMPLITLVATASLMINVGISVVPLLGQLVVVEVIASLFMWLIYTIELAIHGLSPVPFWRAMPNYFRHSGFPTDGGAYLPQSMELCTWKFGVSPRVTTFTTSLGGTVNLDGACIHFVICSLLFTKLYGVPLTGHMILAIALAVFILSFGDSAVSNASIISMTSILTMIGIPTSALGLILGVDAILNIFRNSSNVIGDLTTTLVVGKSEGELNLDKYNAKPKPKEKAKAK